MFATYSRASTSPETYKIICEHKKQGFGKETIPLRESTNKPLPQPPAKEDSVKKVNGQTDFQRFYVRGDFPVSVNFNGANRALKWLVEPSQIDLRRYLSMFLLGLTETQEPFAFIGEQASLQAIAANGDRLADILPDLILPIKAALDSTNPLIVVRGLKALQALLTINKSLAQALIPFYKNLLPAFNRHIHKNKNIGSHIEYSQQKRVNVSDLMIETLQMLERDGGPDAFMNIKYMIPIYESVSTKSKGK